MISQNIQSSSEKKGRVFKVCMTTGLMLLDFTCKSYVMYILYQGNKCVCVFEFLVSMLVKV